MRPTKVEIRQHHIDPASDDETPWMDAWCVYRRFLRRHTVVFTLDTVACVRAERELDLECAASYPETRQEHLASADRCASIIAEAESNGVAVRANRMPRRGLRRPWIDWGVTTKNTLTPREAERLMAHVLRARFGIDPEFSWESIREVVHAL